MRFDRLPSIDHPAIAFRPLAASDLPGWAVMLNRPEVYEPTSWVPPTADELVRYLRPDGGDVADPALALRIAVVARADGAFVGTIGFHTVSPPNRSAEMAYDLDPAWWGRGLASAACRAMLDWGHAEARLIRIQATTRVANLRSQRVLLGCGFRHEGRLEAFRTVRGAPGDFELYAHVRYDTAAASFPPPSPLDPEPPP